MPAIVNPRTPVIVTETVTRYTRTDSGYEVESETTRDFVLGEDEDFPSDYWVNELKQVSFS